MTNGARARQPLRRPYQATGSRIGRWMRPGIDALTGGNIADRVEASLSRQATLAAVLTLPGVLYARHEAAAHHATINGQRQPSPNSRTVKRRNRRKGCGGTGEKGVPDKRDASRA